jgi:hypothetical protein
MKLDDDILVDLLDKGKATVEDQKIAANFLRWMAQFVPDEAAKRRSQGEE